MAAMTDPDTHTVSVMAGTQVVKTEFLINIAGYFIHQDPSPILFVQPTQGAAQAFSKERFAPTIEVTPALRDLVQPPRSRDSENTITHKLYPGGSLDFVGANSPTDLASRPKRIILCDEIDKYPPSAGAEGDPLKLAEERASTYHALGRAKFARTCSPTVEGASRIAREYDASDKRRCFIACPHCSFEQVLGWAHVRWDRDPAGAHLPDSAAIACENCGVIWTERDRNTALDALAEAPGYGWRQTREFSCCGEQQQPERWDDKGRARCYLCGGRAPYAGHAGFHISKLYSKRHRLPELVREFLDAKGDPELIRKFANTALAETWKATVGESFANEALISRGEPYGPDNLPDAVRVVTAFTDVQGDRLETQMVGWGPNEECWPFLYEITHLDPAQPAAWHELDALLMQRFKTESGRALGVAAAGIDARYHTAQVFDFCRRRKGRRIFACMGTSGNRPLWPTRASRSKSNDPVYLTGVDAGKEALMGRLKIQPPEKGERKPGFIHFPVADSFGPEYFAQLTSERRVMRKRMGQPYVVWELPQGKRNEALDTFVGALAVRRSLPRYIEIGLEFSARAQQQQQASVASPTDALKVAAAAMESSDPDADVVESAEPGAEGHAAPKHQAYAAARRRLPNNFINARPGWLNRG
jgi:phage terminase large subunit GpA-like protein